MGRRTLTRAATGATLTRAATIGALAAAASLAGAPGAARAGCITKLPVTSALNSGFAASYHRKLPVRIYTRGPRVRNVSAALFTFKGLRLGTSQRYAELGSSRILRIRLRYGLQVGRFTLVVTGEPNDDPTCGPKKFTQALRFFPCYESLPITFPRPPGGRASDYSDTLSVSLATKGPVIRNIHGSLSDFAGTGFGAGNLPILFGEAPIDLHLTQALAPGSYSVFLTGTIDQPKVCGPKNGKLVLTFQ
jgi:hypothetical protein